MKKNIIILFALLMIQFAGKAQNDIKRIKALRHSVTDSLLHRLAITKQDSSRVMLLNDLCLIDHFLNPDSAFYYGYKALALARDINFQSGEVRSLQLLGQTYYGIGNSSKSTQVFLQALKIVDNRNNLVKEKVGVLAALGLIYSFSKDSIKGIGYLNESKMLADSLQVEYSSILSRNFLGQAYLAMHKYDSALYYDLEAEKRATSLNIAWASCLSKINLGKIHAALGHTDKALFYFHQSIPLAADGWLLFNANYSFAKLFQQIDRMDSCIYYANQSLEIARVSGSYSNAISASLLLSSIYEKKDLQTALEYNQKATAYKDSLFNLTNNSSIATYAEFEEKERERDIKVAKAEFQNRMKLNIFLGSTFTLLVIAFFLFRSGRLKQKAKKNIEKAYDQLKSTQVQLIQSEKMASLGELTAGIAHEIQNPLNFVNNFSEVSSELIEELKSQKSKLTVEEQDELLNDIYSNLEKINHHGKRAADIVKGMLQHSQASSGIKEPTDINKLADEYLRLAYHGLRAKDKDFNATMITDFDESIGKINIIPQDIGRVLLNLINNAFYAAPLPRKVGSKTLRINMSQLFG